MTNTKVFNSCLERLIEMCAGVQECKIKNLRISNERINIINRYSKALQLACNEPELVTSIQRLVDHYVNSDESMVEWREVLNDPQLESLRTEVENQILNQSGVYEND